MDKAAEQDEIKQIALWGRWQRLAQKFQTATKDGMSLIQNMPPSEMSKGEINAMVVEYLKIIKTTNMAGLQQEYIELAKESAMLMMSIAKRGQH